MQKYPEGHASMLLALEDYLAAPQIVIVRGAAAAIRPWQRELNTGFAPQRWMLAVPADAAGLPPALASKPAADQPIAYLCRGTQCSAPIDSLSTLLAELERHDPQAGTH
jgi:uncharacterized protein YyaL (SSP411 family)